MTMSESIPTYAVVGHPNEGKSSVVATLAEDDSVRISPFPGETTHNRSYPVQIDGRTILRFVDTPGFQHPRRILQWFRQEKNASHLAQSFICAHEKNPTLTHDLELLRPLAKGCGIIYVMDGSRPIGSTDRVEIEILRLTGNPRMALINPKSFCGEDLAQWKNACAKSFNAIRIFDAHRATYSERIALLESLKAIHQDWESALAKTIEAFEADWSNRIAQVAGLLCELLRRAITHSEAIVNPKEEDSAKRQLQKQYAQSLHQIEKESHQAIRRLFKHNIFRMDFPPQSILHDDLFTARTWQVLGLSKRQLISAAAALGGGIGFKLDFLLAGLSFGIFTLSGALAGAIGAWIKGENLASTKLIKQKIGGIQIRVGPNTNPQFPFILLDRAILYFQHIANWAHARSQSISENHAIAPIEKHGHSSQWNKDERAVCTRFLKAIANKAPYEKQTETERAFRKRLESILLRIVK